MTSPFAELFGQSPNSSPVKAYLERAAKQSGSAAVPEAEIKAYSDSVYFNYHTLGLSLLFIPPNGSKVDTKSPNYDALLLDGIDVFNALKDAAPTKGKTYSLFPLLPLEIAGTDDSDSSKVLQLGAESTGQDIVKA
ncbi:hypothetical protein M422DRAFT_252238, partial [Sphaerobolus stellatus SS14]